MNFLILLFLCVSSGVQSKSINLLDKIQNLVFEAMNETSPDFEPCNEDLMKRATFYDMIEIKRPRGYFHWCVFICNTTVIQLDYPEFDNITLENLNDNVTGVVQLRSLTQLAGDDFCRINNKINESTRRNMTALSQKETLALIVEELKHNITTYNVVDYNCEHFATKLKFGVPFSSQMDATKKIVSKENLIETAVRTLKDATNKFQQLFK